MPITSVVVAVAGQALAVDPPTMRDTHEMAPQLPMYNSARLDTSRGGPGTGLLDDTDVNQGISAWSLDPPVVEWESIHSQLIPAPISGGQIPAGTNIYHGGDIVQEASHTYLGFDASNNWHVHAFEFSIADPDPGGFIPIGTTINGSPVSSVSFSVGTDLVGDNGMTFDGEVLGYFSASMDAYFGGTLLSTEDFFSGSGSSFAETTSENGAPYDNTIVLEGYRPILHSFPGFIYDKLVIRGAVAVAVPTPGTFALLGLCGIGGVRRRR